MIPITQMLVVTAIASFDINEQNCTAYISNVVLLKPRLLDGYIIISFTELS